jgi:autotransporter-associated beta strand protein
MRRIFGKDRRPRPPPGSWFVGGNWTNGVPTGFLNATVNNGGTAQIPTPPTGTPAATAATLTIGGGSTVQLTAGSTLQVTTLSIGNGGTFHLLGALTVSAPVEIGAGGTFQASSSGSKNTMDFHDNGTFLVDGSNSLVSNISGTGQLVITGTGTVLTVSSVLNTYSGATIINAGAELVAGSATGSSPNSAFIVNSTPGLDIHGFNSTIGSLSGTGTVLNNGAGTAILNVGNDGTNTTFSGALADGSSALELTKIGTGTLALTGINTYSGGTNINGGTLAVNSDANREPGR